MVLISRTLPLLLVAIQLIFNNVTAQALIAISDLIVVDAGDSVVIRLKGYDSKVKNVRFQRLQSFEIHTWWQ